MTMILLKDGMETHTTQDETRFLGFSMRDVQRLHLRKDIEDEARALLNQILCARSLEHSAQLLELAEDTVRLLFRTEALTSSQMQDLTTLFTAASVERADHLLCAKRDPTSPDGDSANRHK